MENQAAASLKAPYCNICFLAFKQRVLKIKKPFTPLPESRKCAECDCPFFMDRNDDRKYCCSKCAARHNVQGFINQIRRLTFTIAEAAEATGLSQSTIRRRLRARNVQQFSTSGCTRIRKSDALKLLSPPESDFETSINMSADEFLN
jgi:hypothetical protein